MTIRDETAVIRKRIKAECSTLSVRLARGTAYGYVEVRGSGEYGHFTDAEIAVLQRLSIPSGLNLAVIDRGARRRWAAELTQGS